MKKFYVLLSVMVLALMTAGFSYAYWSDTLTVNGTAKTGTFDVNLVEVEYYADAYVDADAVLTDDQLTLTLGNLYPGATFTYMGGIINNGSIPAVTDGFVLKSSSGVLFDQLDIDIVYSDSEEWLDAGEGIRFTITVSVPTGVTGYQGETATATYEMLYDQFNK